ncbi:hypothetical protein [Sulfuriflexus mobilis]|uniref:hypothetical protein n=1 Tax=Sulfuriflexus mobilis TaxID=1811807 RepID=UPI000F83C213|nr:hypothetical protein [Sulfuriflexus mobilis]
MSRYAEMRETLSLIDDEAIDVGNHVQISAGNEIAGSLLERMEAIELYVCELIKVLRDYETARADTPEEGKWAGSLPLEFLKWDLLNLVEESRMDTVHLKAMLKRASRQSAQKTLYLN